MNKLFEMIYSEKDSPTNISLIIASIVGFLFYTFASKDTYNVIFVLIATFALVKEISRPLLSKIMKSNEAKSIVNYLSISEKAVINTFISEESVFISHEKVYKKMVEFEENGLESLLARGIINFTDVDNGLGVGYRLSEEVYRLFINQ